ncbi:MAG: glycosyltransferase family 87 protein, partial [Mycobacteriales bacterium]
MTGDRWLRGALLALAVGTVLAWRTTQENSILGNADRLLLEILAWWAAWAVGIACLRRTTARGVLLVVVLGAVALRVAAITAVVPLSDDLYRYAWDGRVQAAGTDPYRYPPTAPELAGLRDAWLFPGAAACAELGREPDCTIINRPEVRTLYPPVAQAWFLLGHSLGASRLQDLGWQLVALLADLATMVLLWRLLVQRGRDPRWVAVYAWSPVAVLEAVQNGHVDGLATLFVVAAVGLAGRRPACSGAALGAAAMVKLYPALLLPVLLARRPVRVLGAFVAVVVVSYLPHVLAVGWDVLGYLPGYLREEDYVEGGRYLLLRPLGLSGLPATLVAGAAGLGVLTVVLRAVRARPDDVAFPALLLFGSALLLATPVQPWYGLPLAALAVLAARPAWLAVPAAAYPAFFAVVPDGPSPGASRTGSAAFALALVAVLVSAGRRRSGAGPAGGGGGGGGGG